MIIFEDVAKVDIDTTVLELLQHQGAVRIYKIKGLDPKIVIRDFRSYASPATDDANDLALINRVAEMSIHQLQNYSMLIDLRPPTGSRFNRNTLSITRGYDESSSTKNIAFDHFDFDNDGGLIYLALYKTKRANAPKETWSMLSV